LAKAIVAYARHFHFFDESTEDGETNNKDLQNSGWLLDTSDFSALPGKGIQCLVNEKMILVGVLFHNILSTSCFWSCSRQLKESFVLSSLIRWETVNLCQKMP